VEHFASYFFSPASLSIFSRVPFGTSLLGCLPTGMKLSKSG
jgi:hypothetical protein